MHIYLIHPSLRSVIKIEGLFLTNLRAFFNILEKKPSIVLLFLNPFALHSLSLISSFGSYNKFITEIGLAYFLQLITGATQGGPTETDVGGFMGLSCVSVLMVGSSCVSGFGGEF